MKTIRQIAKEIGIDKQRVYRHIKRQNITSHQRNGVMYFDDTAEMQIKEYFLAVAISSEAHHKASTNMLNDTVISILKKEIEFKNQIINEQQQTIKKLIKVQSESASHTPQKEQAHSSEKLSTTKPTSAPIARLFKGAK